MHLIYVNCSALIRFKYLKLDLSALPGTLRKPQFRVKDLESRNSLFNHVVRPPVGEVENERLRKGLCLGRGYRVSGGKLGTLDLDFPQLDR